MKTALITNEAGILKALETAHDCDVFYYFSTEKFLLNTYATKTINLLLGNNENDYTLLAGADITVENIINACGTISFFSEKRIVHICNADINSITVGDLDELCDVIQNVENAKIIITGIFNDDKGIKSAKNKKLLQAMPKNAISVHIKKQSQQEITQYAINYAKTLGAVLPYTSASKLLELTKEDYFLINSEIDKLAAAVNYGEITKDIIEQMCSVNIQANAFEMVNAITNNRLSLALYKLKLLQDMQISPIAIVGALVFTYTDMYRVKCAIRQKKRYTDVYKDFMYKGSDYSLKKANEAHKKYTHSSLAQILTIICSVDKQLKSSSVDGFVLMQTALCEIDSVVKA